MMSSPTPFDGAMPLITFTGLPSCGKTRWAKELEQKLQEKIDAAKATLGPGMNYSIIYHSDELLGIDHDWYLDSNQEKHGRASQMSAVKRDLSRSNIVILDSLSYIKGFRYQLYCEAKNIVTPHCVVHVVGTVDQSLVWNRGRSDGENRWDEELVKQLSMRYEEPQEDSRWDSPLFTLVAGDDEEKLPVQEIWDAVVLKKPVGPNAATLVKQTSGNSYLQELDKQTQAVVTKISQYQQLNSIGGLVLIDKEQSLYVELPATTVTIAQLQRIKRSYTALNRMRSVDSDRITPLFVEYVNRSLNDDVDN